MKGGVPALVIALLLLALAAWLVIHVVSQMQVVA